MSLEIRISEPAELSEILQQINAKTPHLRKLKNLKLKGRRIIDIFRVPSVDYVKRWLEDSGYIITGFSDRGENNHYFLSVEGIKKAGISPHEVSYPSDNKGQKILF